MWGEAVWRKALRSCSVVPLLEREDELGVLADAVQGAAYVFSVRAPRRNPPGPASSRPSELPVV